MQSYRRKPALNSLTLRARRRRRTHIIAALVALIVIALIAGCVYLVRAPFLRIQNVQVTGADPDSQAAISVFVESQLVGNYSFFIPKNHVFEYSRLNLAPAILRAFPRLSTVSVTLTSPTTLVVTVSERLPKALWCGADAADSAPCLFLDQDGVAYASVATSSLAYVVYYGVLDTSHVPPRFLSPQQFHALGALVDALVAKAGAGPATAATIDSSGDVDLSFQDGFVLKFLLASATDQPQILLQAFTLALQSQPFEAHTLADFEYLDLRFGQSLYYKLKGGDAPMAASTTPAQ